MAAPAILLIDDDPFALELIELSVKQALRQAKVFTLTDAKRALDICGERRIDCVLVDYEMPGEDGLAVARALRREHPYLPIILCTGAGDETLVAHALTHGINDYIAKPKITPESLGRAIKNAIRNGIQSQIIDEQRKELEDFAFALSHDFKQPVRQLMVFTALIAEAAENGDTAELNRHLKFLNSAAGRLDALVDVMSQYTLLNKAPELEAVALNEVLAGVESSLGHFLAQTGGRIAVGPMPSVRGNTALIGQVLQNLIVNGLKYNTSAAPTVSVTAETKAGFCVIRVDDNGFGIAPEYLHDIFKPLVRLHTNAEYSGTGLGLTLARKAIVAQGGSIWCTSRVGAGSAFFVKIPLAQRKAAA